MMPAARGCILEMPPSEVPGRAVSEDAAASWSAAALCRFAIYAQKTVLTFLAPKPKRQRAGALQKLRHVAAPQRGQCANAPCRTPQLSRTLTSLQDVCSIPLDSCHTASSEPS